MRTNSTQDDEIARARGQASVTRRATCAGLEEILYEPIAVLDHGFIRVIDYMGDDSAIVQAARVSYGRGTKSKSDDRGLIRYLMRNAHTSPFEMLELKLHVKLPIFVARQWVRHRTASINEYSARYSVLDKEFYVPEDKHLAAQSTTNKQGRDTTLTAAEASSVISLLKSDAERNYADYLWMLNEDDTGKCLDEKRTGLARELARINLTLNMYTQWYWKIDLHNLMHFIKLRSDAHAQYEIRAYSEALEDIVSKWVPLSYSAFKDFNADALTFSGPALAVVRRVVGGERVTQETSGLTRSEWREFCDALGIAEHASG